MVTLVVAHYIADIWYMLLNFLQLLAAAIVVIVTELFEFLLIIIKILELCSSLQQPRLVFMGIALIIFTRLHKYFLISMISLKLKINP